ncbi:hypothetical protein Hanom_Chr12g01153281 [Helianthus anomalus]
MASFHHIEAWEVVRKHEKWAPVPLLGEESGSSRQKRKSSDSGNYQAGTPNTEFTSDIPDINVDPSPRRKKRKRKKIKDPQRRPKGQLVCPTSSKNTNL